MKKPDYPIEFYCDGVIDSTHLKMLMQEFPFLTGFTTNPTLMRKAGVQDYERWARRILDVVPGLPISFEVLGGSFSEQLRQAHKLASWGPGVFVKIPAVTTDGVSNHPLIYTLNNEGIQVNVTAITRPEQVPPELTATAKTILSVFAGRVMDTGRSIQEVFGAYEPSGSTIQGMNAGHVRTLWASTREVYNVVQAVEVGAHIITMSPALLDKLRGLGRDLHAVAVDTVFQFEADARGAGYRL